MREIITTSVVREAGPKFVTLASLPEICGERPQRGKGRQEALAPERGTLLGKLFFVAYLFSCVPLATVFIRRLSVCSCYCEIRPASTSFDQ